MTAQGRARYHIRLLGTWGLTESGSPVSIPSSGRRLVAFVGLNGSVSRPHTAGTLWPDVAEQRAHGNLRSAVWRVARAAPHLLVTNADGLGLDPAATVDVQTVRDMFARFLYEDPDDEFDYRDWSDSLISDLLPGWNDDWVIVERERLRQMRIHALESLAHRLGSQQRYAEGMEVAMAAVAAAPLRESAHREVIRIHIAEGNMADALQQFEVCAQLLRSDLGLEPSDRMIDLMQPVLDETYVRVPRSDDHSA